MPVDHNLASTRWVSVCTLALMSAAFCSVATAQTVTDGLPAAAETPAAPAPVPATVTVRLQTSLGPILLAIEKQRAPITAANFLRYVDERRLDGCTFYRAMTLGENAEYGLVQGGLRGNPKKLFKPIAHEATSLTGLSHVSGAVSMARGEPGTATADFFIVLGDLVSLDAQPGADGVAGDPGYAVFGRVLEGMELVRSITERPRLATAPTEALKGQMLASPVTILTARRENASEKP